MEFGVVGGPVEGDKDVEGVPLILLKGVHGESPSPSPSPFVPVVPPSPSGHRSRKEKLVLRSFSTENEEEMQIGFDEPKPKPVNRGNASSCRRASRTKRAISAPEHSARKSSAQWDVDGSLSPSSFEDALLSPSISPVGAHAGDGQFEDIVVDEEIREGSSPRKPKKQKLGTSKGVDLVSRPGKSKAEKHSSSRIFKTSSSSYKKSRPKSIPSFKGSAIKISHIDAKHKFHIDAKHKFRVNSKKLAVPLKLMGNSNKYKPPSVHKPPLVPPPQVKGSEKSLQPQVPLREQKKWLPRRRISRIMLSGSDDPIQILKQPMPVDGQQNSPVKNEPKLSESPKSKPMEPHLKPKSKRRLEGEEEGKEEQELMHYATGLSCLEELLDGRGKVILPELYLSMIQSLSGTLGERKERWKQFMDIFRRTLLESHRKELHVLLEEDSKCVSVNAKKINPFRPVFRMAAVMEDKPSVSYPLVTDEELEAYECLINLNADFECWDDELESGNLFIDMTEMDLRTIIDSKMTTNAAAQIQHGDEKKGLKRVKVKAVPVSYFESQNEHGLFIPEEEFKRRFLNNKEIVLEEMNFRSLRNGKKVELKNIKLESTEKFRVKRKRKHLAETVPEIPIPCPNLIDKETMNLRSGKKIEFKHIDTAQLLLPSIKLELIPEAMMGSPVKNLQQDDYSIRVEADLRRLEAGEDLLFFDLNNTKIPNSNSIAPQNTARTPFDSRYMDNLRQVPVSDPLGSGTNASVSRSLFGVSSSPPVPSGSLSRPSATPSQYFFKPIQPQPLSARFSESGATIRCSKDEMKSPKETDRWGRPEFSSPFMSSDQISSEQKQEQASPFVRKPYSRHRHSKICPPFDNNHCSFSEHFCSYSRAAGSRFCLQHVQEGATVNFERCKYVKGSRECGKFIPKAQFQSVFCDMHARAVAKARLKKMKPLKPLDPTPLLLRDIKKDLERTQGKVLEEDGSGYYRVRRHLFTEDNEAVNNSSDSGTEDEFVIEDYIKHQGECDSDVEDDWAPAPELDYDLLKNAGYYSVTEVAQIYRSKLATLQRLYLRQLDLLKKKYVDSRKDFLRKTQAFRQLRTYITTDPKYISLKKGEYAEEYLQHQIKTTQETRAFLQHAKHTGNRALLHIELLKKRQQLLDSGKVGKSRSKDKKRHPSEPEKEVKVKEVDLSKRSRKLKRNRGQTCCFGIPYGEKCSEKAIPLTKHCRKHITQDPNQKLFHSCNCRFGPDTDDVCKISILSELEKFGCPLHNLPIPVKDHPEGDDKKMKVEEELEKLIEKLGDTSSSSENEDEESDSDDDMVREMEDLVGDEVVDLDHFQEIVSYLQKKGVDLTDTEESDDTDDEDPEIILEQPILS